MDADFGESPMLLSINSNGTRRDVAVAVQKSGFAWALDRDNAWKHSLVQVSKARKQGRGRYLGRIDRRSKSLHQHSQCRKSQLHSRTFLSYHNCRRLVCTRLKLSGNIIWSTANPSNDTSHGPVTLANGVLFAGSMALNGPFYAVDGRNRNDLWSYNMNASVYGGAAVSYGCVYVGSGYKVGLANFHPTWTSGTLLFAFCVV